MASQLGLNHRTVRRGLEELVKAGVVEKRPRVGNFVKYVRPRELTMSVALVCPRYLLDQSEQHPTIGALIGGACRSLDHRDYSVTTLSYRPGCLWEDVGPTALERGVRALLLYPQRDIDPEELRRFEEAGIHVVLAGSTSDPRVMDAAAGAVFATHGRAFETAMRMILSQGHTRVAVTFYTHFPELQQHEAILEKFCAEQPALGGLEQLVFRLPNRQWSDYSYLERLLDRKPRPTALIVPDEVCAAEIFRMCYRRDIKIPDELSLVSLNNTTPLAFPVPLVSTNSPKDLSAVGSRAAEMIITLVDGRPLTQRLVGIECDLQPGESIGPPPSI